MRVLLMFALAVVCAPGADVTFHRDVLPVLQKNCQGCHRPGEAAPMAFMTYEQTRPWAKAIREAVLLKRMPPWFADPHVGKFSNDRSLSESETAVLTKWAATGAREGDPKDAPPPANFVEGWNIGKPDLEFEMPSEFEVPAKGTIEYQYVILPGRFTEDRWVERAEVRPGNRAVVHHVIAFLRPPGSKWLKDVPPGAPFVPQPGSGDRNIGQGGREVIIGYAPGTVPEVLSPGRAKLIPAGSDIVFQLHYTANGKPAKDRTKLGLIFARQPVEERVLTVAAINNKFVIPPGAPNHRVDAALEFGAEVKLIGLFPHMHVRGKSFSIRAVYPTGEKQELLHVPRYDFNWQLSYYPVKDILLPKGSKVECTAHFDNSPNNPANPDPTKEVRWGDQSWEEMMIGFMDVAFDVSLEPRNLFPQRERRSDD
jgi:hypothetical protein